MIKTLFWAVSFFCLLMPMPGAGAQEPGGLNDLDYPTGLVPYTPEEEAWIRENWPVVRRVMPNSIGLQRLNASRGQRGLPPLAERGIKPAPTGADTVAIIEGEPVPLAAGEGADALTELPAHVNNSLLPSFPPIRTQGQLGSCVSFATTYYQMTHTVAMMRGWDAKNGGDAYRFSPKWTYNFVNGGNSGGSGYINSYAILLSHGAATWEQFPYSGATTPATNYREWSRDPEVWRSAIQYRTHGVQQVQNVSTTGFDQVRQLLNNGYVLVFSNLINSWQYTKVGNDPATPPDPYAGQWVSHYVSSATSSGHAMTIVGYDDELWVDINGNGVVDPGERGAFLIANSWGAHWRNAGFVWLAYDALHAESQVEGGPQDRRAAITSNRVYHLTAPASYQPKLLAEFTVHHAKRNQLRMTLGIGAPPDTTPQSTWLPGAINHTGGAYAFDGTSTPVDGTFVYDFTDLAYEEPRPEGAPLDGGAADMRRWFLRMRDNATGDIATLKAFKLIEPVSGEEVEYTGGTVTADNTTVHVWIDFEYAPYNEGPPVIVSPLAVASALGEDVQYTISALGSEPIVFTLNPETLPPGLAFDGTATISGQPTAVGVYPVPLTATNDDGVDQRVLEITVWSGLPTFTLTYTAGPNGWIDGPTPQIVDHGANGQEVTAVADEGYHFTAWRDGVLTESRTETNVTSDVTAMAMFARSSYTLKYTAGPGGAIDGPALQTVMHGEDGGAVTAVAGEGFVFTGWSDGVQSATRQDVNVTGPIDVTAHFAADVPPPVAVNVSIGGEPRVGNTLTGSYDYVGSNSEGATTFRWLRADTADGAYAPIDGATGDTYTLTPDDIGKFIVFEVTPVDAGGVAGEPVTSDPIGPVYVPGDFSGDGVLSGLDIPGFKQALADPEGWAAANSGRPHPNALGDFNGDGVFSGLDIPGFKQALAGD